MPWYHLSDQLPLHSQLLTGKLKVSEHEPAAVLAAIATGVSECIASGGHRDPSREWPAHSRGQRVGFCAIAGSLTRCTAEQSAAECKACAAAVVAAALTSISFSHCRTGSAEPSVEDPLSLPPHGCEVLTAC